MNPVRCATSDIIPSLRGGITAGKSRFEQKSVHSLPAQRDSCYDFFMKYVHISPPCVEGTALFPQYGQ